LLIHASNQNTRRRIENELQRKHEGNKFCEEVGTNSKQLHYFYAFQSFHFILYPKSAFQTNFFSPLLLSSKQQYNKILEVMSPKGAYGWSAVPRSLDKFLATTSAEQSQPFTTEAIVHPNDDISKKTLEYVTSKLSPQTLNHSLRVFAYGYAILVQHFPHFLNEKENPGFLQTFYLTCILHDIGTAEENLLTTHMSFDFYGALVAMDFLRSVGAEKDLVEAVGEAIIRHQDLGTTGEITAVGGLVQVVTVLGSSYPSYSFPPFQPFFLPLRLEGRN
jgi:cyanamide hydratase